MPSAVHEVIVELVRERPASLLALARDAIHLDVDVVAAAARVVDPAVPQLVSPARACDLALEIPLAEPEPGGPTHAGVVVEVQESRSRDKELTWPLYWAQMRTLVKGGPTLLLVITTDRSIEEWAGQTLAEVIPRIGQWAVLGPRSVARISDLAAARRDPVAALMSGFVHAGGNDVDLAPAIAEACSTLPEDRGKLFYDIIEHQLSALAQAAMEAYMEKFSGYVWKGPFALKHREEGRVQGQLEAARRLLTTVLESRGLAPLPSHVATIATTTDLAVLEQWMRRAAVVATVDEVFASS